MNLKTTLVLLIFVLGGGVLYWVGPTVLPDASLATAPPVETPVPEPKADAGTLGFLKNDLNEARLARLEIEAGNREPVVLIRDSGGKWALPGGWPVRESEVKQLVSRLSDLRSRFSAIDLNDKAPELKTLGLDHPNVQVIATIRGDGKTEQRYRLSFGEEAGDANRFSRPSYLRIADWKDGKWQDRPEVVQLAPGLVAFLDRPLTYYQRRRLFPVEWVAREGWPDEETEQLNGQTLTVREQDESRGDVIACCLLAADCAFSPSAFASAASPLASRWLGETSYTLSRDKKTWKLSAPVVDRPDPDRLKAMLSAGGDLWAEEFIPTPSNRAEYEQKLRDLGLAEPEESLTVAPPGGGAPVTLLIGKEAPRARPAPMPDPILGGPPPKGPDRLRYAKLEGNDQIFTIKDGPRNDVFVKLDALRDSNLARFKPEDVRRIVITSGPSEIVLEKQLRDASAGVSAEDRWRIVKPRDIGAETTKVKELLTELSQLKVPPKDVIDQGDAREYGLDNPPAGVTLTVEDQPAEVAGARQTRTIHFRLGKHESDKVFVRVDDWPRINPVSDAVLKLAERPAVAYRGRDVFNFSPADIAQVEVQRGDKEKYVLKQTGSTWRLAAPVDADADPQQVRPLADALGKLQAVEYVGDTPTEEQLDKTYGLAKPELTATLVFADEKKPAQTLLIGKPRGDKEYYAKLADVSDVFVIRKALHDDLNRDSLAYRPRELWHVAPEDVAAVRIQRQTGPGYSVQREDGNWKIAGPFDAPVSRTQAEALRKNLAVLQCERFEAHTAKDLATYGLDKPFLKLTVVEKGEPAKERTLIVGKPCDAAFGTRYAKVSDNDAVFLIGQVLASSFDADALDLLDRQLLAVPPKNITQVRSVVGDSTLTLDHKDDAWHAESGMAKFTPDPIALNTLLGACGTLRADRFAAYGDKIDLAKYGLDKPTATITLNVKEGKPAEHTILLGKPVEDEKEFTYAQVDGGPGVVVLSPFAAATLRQSYLDLVDRRLLRIEAPITTIVRKTGDQELDLAQRGGDWYIVKPTEQRGDDRGLTELAKLLGSLRAKKIAAYPAKDPKDFGLGDSATVLTLKVGENDKGHVLKIGAVVKEEPKDGSLPDRYAQVEGSEAVGVLSGDVAARLLAPPVAFRDHALARFASADRAVQERRQRTATFAEVDGTWKMKEPIETDAEHNDLQAFIDSLARLRADQLVAEKPEDLKPYGLDKPEAHWHFFNGEKEVLNLVIGGPEKTAAGPGPRHYAKLGNSDVVFLLDPKVTGQALAEYRSRKVWKSLDPNEVEKISFTNGGKPFVLERAGMSWQVAGKPEVKVNASVVNDTLAALGALKTERTVADKDPDLKLFGLDAPQLVVEVTMRDESKRVLHIGRSEGESKRSYARVVGGDRGDVFIISEKDGARIVRDLAAFTAGKEKPE